VLSLARIQAHYSAGAGGDVSGTVSGERGGIAGVTVEFGQAGTILSVDEIPVAATPLFVEAVPSINEQAGTGPFYPTGPTDYFGVEYSGAIFVTLHDAFLRPGQVQFTLASDDGAKLFVDGSLLIDNDGLHGDRELSRTVPLGFGGHNIRVLYYENTGGAGVRLNWQGVSGETAAPTVAQLVPFVAKYHDMAFRRQGSTTTDSNGHYLLTNVSPGAVVRAIHSGWQFSPGFRAVNPPVIDVNFTVLTPSAPGLSIERSGTSVIVSWPLPTGAFVLEETPQLAPVPAWSLTSSAYATNLTRVSVIIPAASASKYFRLRSTP
jgi:hypothetical protein